MNHHRIVIAGLVAIGLVAGCDRITGMLGDDAPKEGATADPKLAAAQPAAGADAPPGESAQARGEAATSPGETAQARGGASPPAGDAATSPGQAAPATSEAATSPSAGAAAVGDAERAPTEAATPCIVGRWKAIEYLAEVRRAIAREPTLAGLKKSSSGGLLGYEVMAATDGKGRVHAKAEALRYVFKGKVEGFAVTLTFTLDGESTADYTLVGDDTIVVAKPDEDTFVARANAKVDGVGKWSKSPRVDHDFSGTFNYTCTPDKLEVWRTGGRKDPVEFARER